MRDKTKKESGFTKAVDTAGGLLAFFTIIFILFMYIAGHFDFLPSDVSKVFSHIREIAIIAVVGLSGMEFALKRNKIFTIIWILMLAAVIVFMFFPNAIPGW